MNAQHWAEGVIGRLVAADLLADEDALSPRQIAVLALACHPEEARRTVRGMAEAMGIGRPPITRATDKLEVLGLVRRKADRRDLRSVVITATERGKRRAMELAAIFAVPTQEEPSE